MDRRIRLIGVCFALVAAAGACGEPQASPAPDVQPTVRLLFVGDVMLGRSVAPIVEADPEGVFRDVRRVVRDADLAAMNLESPLTTRPHISANPYELEADPASAQLLSGAGFDVASIANNHAGDAGAASVLDTIDALSAVGIDPVGGGGSAADAGTPVRREVHGLTVAYLAFDASLQGLAATDTSPGVAPWDAQIARSSVEDVRKASDVVVVSLHGGVPGGAVADPVLMPVAEQLASWGVDVVWGHGSHTERPIDVIDPDDDGRPTVVATSLGNFLFDQLVPDMSAGPILEVMVGEEGVVAHRVGGKEHDDLRVHFTGWRTPDGDAAMLLGSWWSLDRAFDGHHPAATSFGFPYGDVVASSSGDLDGDGDIETLVSFRHRAVDKSWDPGPELVTDASGRSAHIGVLDDDGLGDDGPVWFSRRPPHPVGDLVACDGTGAFAYTTLDDPTVIAIGAGTWGGFGFVLEAELEGSASIGCADVDGDGRTEPIVTQRG